MICPFAFFLHICCFLDLFFCFYFALFLLFAWKKENKKQKQSKTKKHNTCKRNANGQVHFSPMFPLFDFPFFPLFFHVIVLLCFLDFADLLFGFSFFCFCRAFFQVLIKLE